MLSNYTIKQALPRLIIAAIAINLSYWICALAVDASNLLGESIFALLKDIAGDVIDSTSLVALVEVFLMGGAASAVTLTGVAATAAAFVLAPAFAGQLAMGAALLFIALLLGVAIAILVAVLILAARQALIVILVFVSPIAFALYILPGTKPLFDKWRKLFTTMLVFYPLFALMYGGSLIAAGVLISMSGDGGTDAKLRGVFLLMGFTAQFAPLLLTPWLIKNSTGFLGKMGEKLQSRGRALTAPIRRKGMSEAKQAGSGAWKVGKGKFASKNFNPNTRTGRFLSGVQRGESRRKAMLGAAEAQVKTAEAEHELNDDVTRGFDQEKRTLEEEQKALGAQAGTAWTQTGEGANAILTGKEAEGRKKIAETELDTAWTRSASGSAVIGDSKAAELTSSMEKSAIESGAEAAHIAANGSQLYVRKAASDAELSGAKAGQQALESELKTQAGLKKRADEVDESAWRIQQAAIGEDIEKRRADSAGRQFANEQANLILNSAKDEVADYAGGIDPGGARRARAIATNVNTQAIAEATTQIKSTQTNKGEDVLLKTAFDPSTSEEEALAAVGSIAERKNMGAKIELVRELNNQMIAKTRTVDARIRAANPTKTDKEIAILVDAEIENGTEFQKLRRMQQQTMADMKEKPFGMGETMLGDMGRGVSRQDFDSEVRYRVAHKMKGRDLATSKPEDIQLNIEMIEAAVAAGDPYAQEMIAGFEAAIADANASSDISGDIKMNIKEMVEDRLVKTGYIRKGLAGPGTEAAATPAKAESTSTTRQGKTYDSTEGGLYIPRS